MTGWLEQHAIPCFFKSTFGMECPGCGMQRALIALLKGDILLSLQSHPALIPLILTTGLLAVQLKIKHPNGGKWVMWSFIAVAVITVVQFIVKQALLADA